MQCHRRLTDQYICYRLKIISPTLLYAQMIINAVIKWNEKKRNISKLQREERRGLTVIKTNNINSRWDWYGKKMKHFEYAQYLILYQYSLSGIWHFIFYKHVPSHHIITQHISYYTMSCHIMSCHITSYYIISYYNISYLIMFYHIKI